MLVNSTFASAPYQQDRLGRCFAHDACGNTGSPIGRSVRPARSGGSPPRDAPPGTSGTRVLLEEPAVNSLKNFVIDFVKREDGPTAVEYAVMLALIIVVCITAITTLGSNANATFTNVGTAMDLTTSS